MTLTPLQFDQLHTAFGLLCILPVIGTVGSSIIYLFQIANGEKKEERISIFIPLFCLILLIIFASITAYCPQLPAEPPIVKCVK